MLKILFIDDSSFQRRIVSDILREAGYDPVVTEDGKRGIDLAQKEKPHLLITDLLMPDYDGYYVLKEAQACRLGIPILILTSDIQDTTHDRCLSLGAAGVVNKPVKKEVLLPAIAKVLSGERL
jgi:CheY-like chemotaxis protein